VKQLHAFVSAHPTRRRLRRAFYRGLPDELRVAVWRSLSNVDLLLARYVGFYQRLCRSSCQFTALIEMDVPRTCPPLEERALAASAADAPLSAGLMPMQPILFEEQHHAPLYRVLHAYSLFNPAIGYHQGINFCAAPLVALFDEEEAFWLLVGWMQAGRSVCSLCVCVCV
jgi:TBC1 domain family member 6